MVREVVPGAVPGGTWALCRVRNVTVVRTLGRHWSLEENDQCDPLTTQKRLFQQSLIVDLVLKNGQGMPETCFKDPAHRCVGSNSSNVSSMCVTGGIVERATCPPCSRPGLQSSDAVSPPWQHGDLIIDLKHHGSC